MRWRYFGGFAILMVAVGCAPAAARTPDEQPGSAFHDGHTRPRALAVDARGDLLYVALSTANRLAVIDVGGGRARHVADLPTCAFPDALAPLPGGGVVVGCRFAPALRVVTRAAGPIAGVGAFTTRVVDAGPQHGNRGLAVDAAGRFAYVGSPPQGGVKIVDLSGPPGAPVRFQTTGSFPQTLRLYGPDVVTPDGRPLLLVSNFIGHTVSVHAIAADGGLSPALQTIRSQAPVLDLAVVPAGETAGGDLRGALLLATHEDRPLSREHISVEGLDSVVLVLRRGGVGAVLPFVDPGAGQRTSLNLTERARSPLVGLDALAIDGASGRLAIAGAGSDNIVVTSPASDSLRRGPAVTVGANPSALAFLPDGRVVTADRLSDTVTLVAAASSPTPEVVTVTVGVPARSSPADRGELLFYSRALVPHNVATGSLSVYTCAACHADGHVDGRLHPSKRNRFFSTTQTCRGLAGTEPFLTLGKPATFVAFADNIVSTHAQGVLDSPDTFDRYPVDLRLRTGGEWKTVTLSPAATRSALAAYMKVIPVEPSPFVTSGRRHLTTQERRGLVAFRDNCTGCHRLAAATGSSWSFRAAVVEGHLLRGDAVLTNARLYDVGTPILGDGGNNPPSLRGVWAAAPYFSDGSAPTLDDVVRRSDPTAPKIHAAENAQRLPAFSAATRADLVAFLRAL